ncbi:MAG: CGNR zinc finger domain-containing protein, partial [Thermomicrobiales bacterium]
DRILWPVARSAVDLLMHGETSRMKECAEAAGGCSWLFYDTSKNASRRWCSMEGCGSSVKMQRYHARRRQLRG